MRFKKSSMFVGLQHLDLSLDSAFSRLCSKSGVTVKGLKVLLLTTAGLYAILITFEKMAAAFYIPKCML